MSPVPPVPLVFALVAAMVQKTAMKRTWIVEDLRARLALTKKHAMPIPIA